MIASIIGRYPPTTDFSAPIPRSSDAKASRRSARASPRSLCKRQNPASEGLPRARVADREIEQLDQQQRSSADHPDRMRTAARAPVVNERSDDQQKRNHRRRNGHRNRWRADRSRRRQERQKPARNRSVEDRDRRKQHEPLVEVAPAHIDNRKRKDDRKERNAA